jgi:hypothetical protein
VTFRRARYCTVKGTPAWVDPMQPRKYWPGAEERISKELRFLGYFMFDHRLSTGETPAEAAAGCLCSGAEKAEALDDVYPNHLTEADVYPNHRAWHRVCEVESREVAQDEQCVQAVHVAVAVHVTPQVIVKPIDHPDVI